MTLGIPKHCFSLPNKVDEYLKSVVKKAWNEHDFAGFTSSN